MSRPCGQRRALGVAAGSAGQHGLAAHPPGVDRAEGGGGEGGEHARVRGDGLGDAFAAGQAARTSWRASRLYTGRAGRADGSRGGCRRRGARPGFGGGVVDGASSPVARSMVSMRPRSWIGCVQARSRRRTRVPSGSRAQDMTWVVGGRPRSRAGWRSDRAAVAATSAVTGSACRGPGIPRLPGPDPRPPGQQRSRRYPVEINVQRSPLRTGREQYSDHAEYLSRSGRPDGYSLGW